jgi:hypothetical protein
LLLSVSTVFSAPLDEKRILVSKVGDNKYKMRIYFNYENPYTTQQTLLGRAVEYFITLPIPDKFELLEVNTEVKYTPSFVLFHGRSSVAIVSNGHVTRQFKLNEERFKDSGKVTVTSPIPIDTLMDYNKIGIKIIQHYVSGMAKDDLEDTSSPELWSQIDLQNSYVDLKFKIREFPERISAIKKFMFDEKSVFKDNINLVFPKVPTDDDFFNYSFIANSIGRSLKFRDIDFSVSTKVLPDKNNIIIMPRKDIKELFQESEIEIADLEEKIAGTINVIQNPIRRDKGMAIITGENQKEILNGIYRFANDDVYLIDSQSVTIFDTEIPPPSEPYTAPGFVSTGDKVLFSDLGYKTRTFYGEESTPLYLDFKLYPTVKYRLTDSIRSVLNIVQGGILRADSATNMFLNEVLAYQVRTVQNKDEEKEDKTASQRFELGKKNMIPTTLLRKGSNRLRLQFAMVPVNGPQLIRFNNDILKLTLRDDSYLHFPTSKTEIELPNLKYVSELAFPFSIYPDLQKTGILITDFDSRTIASAMQIAFHLGRLVEYPSYRLFVTADLNKILERDIISVGSQVDRFSILYKDAPLHFSKDGLTKELGIASEYVEDGGFRRRQYTAKTKIVESVNLKNYLVVQSYQSPFNKRRVVVEVSSTEPETLIEGVQNGLSPINLGSFDGDLWLYNIDTKKTRSFRMKDTYILDEVVEGHTNKRLVDKNYKGSL